MSHLVLLGAVVLLSTEEPVRLPAGVSPNGRFEVALEADADTPRYQAYQFKGSDEEFPGILVLDKPTGRPLARIRWPGDPTATSVSPLRERARVLWRHDSTAVVVNFRESYHWFVALFVEDATRGRFAAVPLPDFAAVAGRPAPGSADLRPRSIQEAERWTDEGHLLYYTGLVAMRPVSQPLTYRATLQVTARGCQVLSREAVEPDHR